RSEERFSRNAETELVCRLLLEKKTGRSFRRLPRLLTRAPRPSVSPARPASGAPPRWRESPARRSRRQRTASDVSVDGASCAPTCSSAAPTAAAPCPCAAAGTATRTVAAGIEPGRRAPRRAGVARALRAVRPRGRILIQLADRRIGRRARTLL